ncbi:MAG: CAAX geranylgeranyltransferase alpha subunit [Chrysothrix sp. TS-e1954]|nr:MAG: CAAX geranylgeranyltransferase alpha subunit [Chrysothrix sp. TS-e1954]
MMGRYSNDPQWEDVVPISQEDSGPNALAVIAYTEEYSEASSYMRAIMAANEHSERVLSLTQHLISINPGHYTVWLYRADTLFQLGADLHQELEWLNGVSLKHIKNYQIWHHRQMLLTRLKELEPPLEACKGESEFLSEMFEQDVKNYHVWSYRQWLVREFGLWEGHGELEEAEAFLARDIRNNSAWNFRWFLAFGREEQTDWKVPGDAWDRELAFTKQKIEMLPQNESPWSYMRGLLEKHKKPLSGEAEFASRFANVERPDEVRSSYALDFLADAYAEDEKRFGDARRALELLETRYDPIRANYWNYRKTLLGQSAVAVG